MGSCCSTVMVVPSKERTPSPKAIVEPETYKPPPTPELSPFDDTSPTSELSTASSDDLNKTSDFESFIIPFESDSDEVKITPTEAGYPDPVPVNADMKQKSPNKIKWFDCDIHTGSDEASVDSPELISQAELDKYAKQTPKSALQSFKSLIAHLEKPAKGKVARDEIMVRAIIVWLSNQEIEKFASERGTEATPLGFLSLLGRRLTTYSTFFTILCREADVKCAQIHGVCKAGDYQPGDCNDDEHRCPWNAVYVNNSWKIIHPFWACRSVFGKQSGGWIKLEVSGQTIGQRQTANSGVLKNAFNEYYIMPDPSQFIYACHPDDDKWQLISNPITRGRFWDEAYLLPPFWGLGMKLISENVCLLKAPTGSTTITLETPKETANMLNLDYMFLLKEGSTTQEAENKMLRPENLPRLVAKIRNATEWNFDIQLPVAGTYKIVIYGAPYQQPLLRCCEFAIKCTKSKQDCKLTPFNPGMLGFGPGPTCEKAGLFLPSHRNGLVTVEKSKPTILSFLLDSDVAKLMRVKTMLFDSNSNECSGLVHWSIKSKELKITTTIVKEGDYGLQIFTGTVKEISADVEENEVDCRMSIVCNYLFTTTSKFIREKANQRLARRNLLSSIENGGVEDIKNNITKCKKEKISENDLDIENAQKKLDVLQLRKDVHDAYMRRNLHNTEKTLRILQQSVYEKLFKQSIRHLENLASELKSLHGFTQELPNILRALTELNKTHLKNEIVINALMALVLLFGESTENIEDMQTIAKLTPKVRNQKNMELKQSDAKQAQAVINKHTYEQTRNVNAAAASVHKWVNNVTSTLLQRNYEEED